MAKIDRSDYSDKDSLVSAIIDVINEHDVKIALLATEAPVAALASPAAVVLEKPAVMPAAVTPIV